MIARVRWLGLKLIGGRITATLIALLSNDYRPVMPGHDYLFLMSPRPGDLVLQIQLSSREGNSLPVPTVLDDRKGPNQSQVRGGVYLYNTSRGTMDQGSVNRAPGDFIDMYLGPQGRGGNQIYLEE